MKIRLGTPNTLTNEYRIENLLQLCTVISYSIFAGKHDDPVLCVPTGI